jgi:hypothetical protein
VWHGFLKAGRQVVLYAIGLPLLPFFAWGLVAERRNPTFAAVPIALAVWLVGLAPVTQFYDSARHVEAAQQAQGGEREVDQPPVQADVAGRAHGPSSATGARRASASARTSRLSTCWPGSS